MLLSNSPVSMCGILYLADNSPAWVPLPDPGGPSKTMFIGLRAMCYLGLGATNSPSISVVAQRLVVPPNIGLHRDL